MSLGRFHLHDGLALQHFLFRHADFGVANHAALQQQIARRRTGPGVKGYGRFTFAGPGNDATHPLKLFMYVLRGFDGRFKQLAEGVGDQLRVSVLNQVCFTGLGDQRQRERIQRFQAAVGAPPAR